MQILVLDYLGYYPFVDMADTVGVFPGSGLSRYTDGVGVQIMPVLVAPQVGGARFTVSYTNQAGTPGRTSGVVSCNAGVINGTIVCSGATGATFQSSPFIPLQFGDTGVRSIESVTYSVNDVGLLAFVLVKVIAFTRLDPIPTTTPATTTFSATEVDYALDQAFILPVIKDDAYLNFICMPAGTIASAVFSGLIETIWST
jgi:hypothetical protein